MSSPDIRRKRIAQRSTLSKLHAIGSPDFFTRSTAGQTAFYSQRILHRASYLASKKRATLHGCYGGIPTSDAYEADGKASLAVYERARMVLQHGVEWMREDDFGQGLPDRLQPRECNFPHLRTGRWKVTEQKLSCDGVSVWRNLLEMEGRHSIMDLGYSLDG